MSRKGLEARSEHAGDADLEANTAIKDLCSCDPYLRSAHTLELLNAMELVDALYIAVMYAAQYSRRTQRRRPFRKSQLATAARVQRDEQRRAA